MPLGLPRVHGLLKQGRHIVLTFHSSANELASSLKESVHSQTV